MSEYQVMPELTVEEYAELKADIAQRGVMVPIEYDEHGHVLDGYHRLRICGELGIKDFPKVIRAGMTEAEKLTHARKLNMARRQLTGEQKRELIRDQLKATPEQSDRQIAKALGVDHKTITAQRKGMETRGEIPHIKSSIDTLGREQPRYRNIPTIQEERSIDSDISLHGYEKEIRLCPEQSNAEQNDTHTAQQEEISERVESSDTTKAIVPEFHTKAHVSYNSGNNEWYTPSEYIELARKVMGSIDLDPASSEKANAVVQAERYYTAEDDGLSQEWYGNVWLNPPYASELIMKFVDKFASVAECKTINQAVILVNNATETEWFSKLAEIADAVCFPKGRVKFYAPDGKIGAPLQGQAILYFGAYADCFVDTFRAKGWCALLQ